MRNLKRDAAVVAASATIAALGLGGVMSAQASSTHPPSQSQVQNLGGEEGTSEGVEGSDGPDVGLDADPNEPGHQDADESGEAVGESESATDDGPNVGLDADPNESGHQDADESGDDAGE